MKNISLLWTVPPKLLFGHQIALGDRGLTLIIFTAYGRWKGQQEEKKATNWAKS